MTSPALVKLPNVVDPHILLENFSRSSDTLHTSSQSYHTFRQHTMLYCTSGRILCVRGTWPFLALLILLELPVSYTYTHNFSTTPSSFAYWTSICKWWPAPRAKNCGRFPQGHSGLHIFQASILCTYYLIKGAGKIIFRRHPVKICTVSNMRSWHLMHSFAPFSTCTILFDIFLVHTLILAPDVTTYGNTHVQNINGKLERFTAWKLFQCVTK